MKSLKTVKRIAVSSAGAVSLAIANAHKAAADQIENVQGSVSNIAGTTGAQTDLTKNIGNIINIMIGVIGIAAVIMLIIGGFRYVFSQGDEKGVKGAKDTILYSIIGIVVALLAFAIVNFVLGGLQGTS
jgi:magnesium-transporting ATPase (P-type)